MKKLIILLALFLGISLLVRAQGPKPIIFIFDASGSMWQKVEDEYKIVLARTVLADLTAGMDADQPLGLVAYGHRQKSDCADIEELLPATNTDKLVFQKALEGLNPTGKTPLAQSARQVIDQLKASKQSATIILITDGIETCEGDLCQIVGEAKKAGIDFVMHIIGFDLGESDRQALECAARASDGLYIDASDKGQLEEALEQTSELTVDVPKGKLSVEVKRNDEKVDGAIMVYKAGTDEDVAGMRSYSGPNTNPAVFNIPAGTYDVEVSLVRQKGISPLKMEGIVVTETEMNEQLFDFTSGYIELTVTDAGELHDATVYVRQHSQKATVTGGRTYSSSSHNPFKKELTPGIYDIDIGSVSIKGADSKTTVEKVEIKAGQTTRLAHSFDSAVLKVGASFQGGLCDATVNIVSVDPRQPVAGGRTYSSASSNPKSFLLSPGEYEVEVKGVRVDGDPREKFTVTLKPGDTLEKLIKW